MNANKYAIALLAIPVMALAQVLPAGKVQSAAVVAPVPLTLGELASQARQRRIAEETKPTVPTIPAGMTIVPSTAILSTSATTASAPHSVKAKKAAPVEVVPGILAIAKTAKGVRYVELGDTNGPVRLSVGQATSSGWTVVSIGAKFVELSKPAEKKKSGRHLTLSVSGA